MSEQYFSCVNWVLARGQLNVSQQCVIQQPSGKTVKKSCGRSSHCFVYAVGECLCYG